MSEEGRAEAPERIRVCIRAGKADWIGVAYADETADPDAIHEYVRAQPPTADDVELPPQPVVIQGIVERAGKARAELAEILQVPAVWPEILAAVKQLKASGATND